MVRSTPGDLGWADEGSRQASLSGDSGGTTRGPATLEFKRKAKNRACSEHSRGRPLLFQRINGGATLGLSSKLLLQALRFLQVTLDDRSRLLNRGLQVGVFRGPLGLVE